MKKLAIVGTHPGTRDQGPFEDLDYDIWVFNEAPQAEWCKRWTACFQMHKAEVYTSPNNMVDKTHWEWLQKDHGGARTIYLQEMDTRIPNGCRFPLDEIREFVPAARLGMLTSTVSMALALGLYLGYETIELWGVDLGSNTEYAYQQMGFAYWVGVALATIGDGFKLHSGSQHFSSRVYGYEGETQISRDYFEARVEVWEGKKKSQEWAVNKLRNRFEEAIREGKADKLAGLILEAEGTTINLGQAVGALQEARQYAGREDPIARQQFERRGAQAQLDGEKRKDEMNKTLGSLEYVLNAWIQTRSDVALKQVRHFYDIYLQKAVEVGGFLGAMQENFSYMGEYDSRIQAAGGVRTLKALGMAE